LTPIFIPSKGRPNAMKTCKQFDSNNYIVVVEPQEEADYRLAGHKRLLVLPASHQGIAFVRNFILEHAIANQLPKFWMLDDDITSFKQYVNSTPKNSNGEQALKDAEELFTQVPNLGQAALEYNQFAWSGRNQVSVLGYCDVAVLIFPSRVNGIRYRSHMNLKEDRDFTLQVLASGRMTARACKIAFAVPKNGSNQGGLYDEYAADGREREASERMIKEWPNICTWNIKPDGRPDISIHWKKAYRYYQTEKQR
jgi:hypothetical protein